MSRRPAALALAVLLPALLLGCGGQEGNPATGEPPPPSTAPTTPTTTTGETTPAGMSLAVYLLRGEKLGVAARRVLSTPAVGGAAVRELLEGPTDTDRAAGLGTAVPAGTRLLGLTIAGGVATVDLSREFESGGGSLSITARVAQVVATLTQFPTVQAVSFQLEGEPLEALGGEGLVLDPPVDRADFESVTPAILVESPAPGVTVAPPVRLQGTANTFEATFQARLLSADGTTLAERFVTATSGSGTRGTFDATLELTGPASGAATLEVFEESAEDGSRVNVVQIPVVLGG